MVANYAMVSTGTFQKSHEWAFVLVSEQNDSEKTHISAPLTEHGWFLSYMIGFVGVMQHVVFVTRDQTTDPFCIFHTSL